MSENINATLKKLRNARKLGIALGGGGARGIAHFGVLKVLDNLDVHPDVVSGTSFGSIVGAFYCSGYTWQEMVEMEKSIKWIKLIDVSLSGGLMKGDALGKVLSEYLPATFEDLKKPLSVVATNIETGKRVEISSGDLIKAVRASSCFPGVFQPVEIDGMALIDGGLVDNVPISALKSYRVDATIAVNVNSPLDYSVMKDSESNWWTKLRKKAGLKKVTLPFDILVKCLDIMLAEITAMNTAKMDADLTINASLAGIRMYNFDKFEEILAVGEQAAYKALHLKK